MVMLLAASRLRCAATASFEKTRIPVQTVAHIAELGGIATPAGCWAIGGGTPIGQLNAEATALVGIRRKAVAVTAARGALADVHAAGGDVVIGIKSTITVSKYFRDAQRPAVEVGLTLVACRRRHNILPHSRARLGSAHLPRVGKVPHLVVAMRPAIPARQIIPSAAIVIAAQSAQMTLVLRRHRHLQKVVAIPLDAQPQLRPQHDAALRQTLNTHIMTMSIAVAAVVRVGQHDTRPIDFNSQLLAEIDAQSAQLKCDRLWPG